jgi:hypothetical protein
LKTFSKRSLTIVRIVELISKKNEKHLSKAGELLENGIKRVYSGIISMSKATHMFAVCVEQFGAFCHEMHAREGIWSDDNKLAFIMDSVTKNRPKITGDRQEN